jgi:hypothetical protein
LDISISIYYLSYNKKNKIVNIFIQSLYIHTLNDKIINSIHTCFHRYLYIILY